MLERSLLTILSIDSSDDVAREWQFYSMEWIYQFFDQWIITILFQKNTGKPTYQSDARNGKHKDIVWQVNLVLKMMIMMMMVVVVVVGWIDNL